MENLVLSYSVLVNLERVNQSNAGMSSCYVCWLYILIIGQGRFFFPLGRNVVCLLGFS